MNIFKKILLSAFGSAFAINSWAGFYPLELKNFQMDLTTTQATLSWEKLSIDFPEFMLMHRPLAKVFPRQGNSIFFETESLKMRVALPVLFPDAQVYSLPSFDIFSDAGHLDVDLPLATWTNTNGETSSARGLKINGVDPRPLRYKSTDENIIDGILAQTDLSFTFLSLPTTKPLFAQFGKALMTDGTEFKGQNIEFNQMENGKLTIKNGAYGFEAKLVGSLKVNFTLEGLATLDQPNRLLSIRIDKARAGIISVKDMIFDELKKNKNPNITIANPYIRIKL